MAQKFVVIWYNGNDNDAGLFSIPSNTTLDFEELSKQLHSIDSPEITVLASLEVPEATTHISIMLGDDGLKLHITPWPFELAVSGDVLVKGCQEAPFIGC